MGTARVIVGSQDRLRSCTSAGDTGSAGYQATSLAASGGGRDGAGRWVGHGGVRCAPLLVTGSPWALPDLRMEKAGCSQGREEDAIVALQMARHPAGPGCARATGSSW